MDEQLKARLIGAVVLVAIAVLLIPELLSGRKADTHPAAEGPAGRGMRTYTIDLTGGAASSSTPSSPSPPPSTAAKRGAGDLPAPLPATSPVTPKSDAAPAAGAAPGNAAPAAVTVPSQPTPRPVAPPAAAAPPVASPAPPPASPSPQPKPAVAAVKGGWSVQVGAFSTAAAATKLINELNAAGYAAYPSPISKSGKTLHRVRVGPVNSKADAEQLAARLKGRSLPATVVTND